MYAIIGQYAYHPEMITQAGTALTQAQLLHAGQPGYAGSIVVDDGKHLTAINLWHTEHDAAAGREAIGAQVQRLLEPLMASPSPLLTAGQVAANDLARE